MLPFLCLILQPYFRQREKEKPVAAASVSQKQVGGKINDEQHDGQYSSFDDVFFPV
jgi:hypothetical protein